MNTKNRLPRTTSGNMPRKRQMTMCRGGALRTTEGTEYEPTVRLKGRWLRQYGFKPGHVVDIVYQAPGRMLICVAEQQRFEGI